MNRKRQGTRFTTPLAHSRLAITITDLVAEYQLTHVFRNAGTLALEAVYSFPVPLDAAFMGMDAHLGGQHRVAEVVARTQATREYDDAVAVGDSAVLLEQVAPGLLCVDLGNLKPGEEGRIVLRFAAPLGCSAGVARFSLPLAYRPRYGRSTIDLLAAPAHDFAVEHPLQASIRVQGLLAHSPVSCASHAARFKAGEFAQEIELNQAMLDRDLVLVFDLPAEFSGEARLVRDGRDTIGLLSFSLPASLQPAGPCDLQLLLDCSGSMQGDAVSQSRAALAAVAGALTEADRVQVLRFGSSTQALFRRALQASPRVCEALVELAAGIAADLGGTEMGLALETALDGLNRLPAEQGRSRAIFLVTDGAVHAAELAKAQARAVACGIRIFVVAVGSSAGVDVLAPLATATCGTLERAVPAEPIDAVLMRQLGRARQGAPLDIQVDWGSRRARALPMEPTYAGDALRAVAMLPALTTLRASVRVAGEQAPHEFTCAHAEERPALRALAGQAAWRRAEGKFRKTLALRYGLITPETSAVLTVQRKQADKVEGLPQVAAVPHMLPAGMLSARRAPATLGSGDFLSLPALLCRRSVEDQVHYSAAGYDLDFADDHGMSGGDALYEPDLEPAWDEAMLQAILDVLLRWLLGEERREVSTDGVLAQIAPEHRAPATQWLARRYPQGLDHAGAVELLGRLLEAFPGMPLSDEQEARLACLTALPVFI
ncbi:VIT and vWA domain-containing protein [Dokdonella sp.]|uniref:VIT and vWA domain-containing protein n=1 Tax=Dokdonella sp. TaxID=2291710 RepID=UPI0031C6D99F|nr:VIT and VWA domain-containing protein [Dokdonella sp.]